MKFKSFSSSSKGNLNMLSDGETTILIDCGIAFKKTRKLLNHNISGIDGVLCTHFHADHSKALFDLSYHGVDCYALAETFENLQLKGHRFHEINYGKFFEIGTFKILPFKLEHDVPCCGFLIQSGFERALYITDTAYCKYRFNNIHILAIECNYDLSIVNERVDRGEMHKAQKSRLLATHFSLDNVKDFIKANDTDSIREIHLMHLSNDNSDADRFEREIKKLVGCPVYICDE